MLPTLLLLLLSVHSSADTEHTNGYWAGLFTRSEITESVNIHQEFQLRKNTETGITTQSLFRAGPLWQVTDNIQLGFLYAFVRTGPFSEHRLTQQIVYNMTDSFSLRSRVEQRTMEKENGISLRARLLARYQYSWNDSFSIVGWSEYFYQASRPDWIYDSYFDRHRYFLGMRSPLGKVTLEYGYMNQYANRDGSDLNEHLFLVYLII